MECVGNDWQSVDWPATTLGQRGAKREGGMSTFRDLVGIAVSRLRTPESRMRF